MTRNLRRSLYLASLATVGAALAPGGCVLQGTGGRLVELELVVRAGGTSLGRTVTGTDPPWTIELEEARVIVGAVYLFSPMTMARARPAPSLVPRALAHPGDDNLFGVTALAEHREQVVVDGLSTATAERVRLLGEAGDLGAASVWLDEPRGAAALASGPTRGRHAFVRGTARRGEREVRFEATMHLENTPLRRRVDNVRFAPGARLEAGDRVVFEVWAERWLRAVDFDLWLSDERTAPDVDGVYRPAQPSVFHTGWLIHFHDPDAFRVWVESGDDA